MRVRKTTAGGRSEWCLPLLTQLEWRKKLIELKAKMEEIESSEEYWSSRFIHRPYLRSKI